MDNWEKAVSAATKIDIKSEADDLSSIKQAMVEKQRELVQDEWDNEFKNLPKDFEVEHETVTEIPSWANYNKEGLPTLTVNKSELDDVKALLQANDCYYSDHGIVGSIKILIHDAGEYQRIKRMMK